MEHPESVSTTLPDAMSAERAINELETAIELVRRGLAARVLVTGLVGLENVAATALVKAQQARVRFALIRDPADAVTAVVGPRAE